MRDMQSKYALLVDDDPQFLTTARLMLGICGFRHVKIAEDGNIALEYLLESRFDLILSDWNMGVMDGVELLRRTRQLPGTANTPFILATASLTETAWRGAIQHGASEFLVKPFSLSDLRAACHLCLGMHEAEPGAIPPLEHRLRLRRYRV